MRLLYIFFMLLFSEPRHLNSAEITYNIKHSLPLIEVNGEIKEGDDLKFKGISRLFSAAGVILNSPGGNLAAGLAIGDEIRRRGFHTGIAPNTMCASACALAWLAGDQKWISASSKLGFHAAYKNSSNGITISPGGNALIGAYLSRLGLSNRAIYYLSSTPPEQMNWLNAEGLTGAGIEVKILDLDENKKIQMWFVDNLDPNGDNWLALKAGPDIKSRRIKKLSSGTLLYLKESKGDWRRVRLDDGVEGWVFYKYISCCR